MDQQYEINVFSSLIIIVLLFGQENIKLLMPRFLRESDKYIDINIVKTKACKNATPNSNNKIEIKGK